MRKEMKNKNPASLGLVVVFILAVLVLIGLLGFDTVDASQKGVKVRFGKIRGTMDPGLEWTGLFTSVYSYDLRIRNMEVKLEGNQAAVDKDGQEVYAIIKVNYRLKPDAQTVLKAKENLGNDNQLEHLLNVQGLVKEGFKSVIAKYELKDILADRSKIKEEAIVAIENKFPAEYFVLENIVIENFDFNEEIKSAINAKKVATEEAKAREEKLKVAEADKNIAIMNADAALEVRKKEADANAYQIERMAEAEARALELKAKELTPLMIQNNWIDAWGSGAAVPTYVAGSAGNSFLMEMPME